jgi:GT2 family glycosyltransferase
MIHRQAFISVVVPSYNRPIQLFTCLQALSRLDYPVDRFEVIVIDDGSKTSLEPVVSPFRSAMDLQLITRPNSGCGAARNAGSTQAKGDFLAFTDDDAQPASDWLSKLSVHFASAPDHMIGGRTVNSLRDNPYSTASQLLIDYLYAYYNANPTRATFLAGNNLALPARLFRQLGGFNTALRVSSEDREFCDRWCHHGFSITYAPEVIVKHAHRLNLTSFWEQHFRYGRGAYHFRQVRLSRGQPTVRREPLRFYLDLLSYPFKQGEQRPFLLALLLMGSQVANASGFLWERGVRREARAHWRWQRKRAV